MPDFLSFLKYERNYYYIVKIYNGDFLTKLCGVLVLCALILGPFYWPASNAAWASFLRLAIVLTVLFALFRDWPLAKPDIFQWMVCVFWLYLFINSAWVGADGKSARRLLLIGCFIFAVSRIEMSTCKWRLLLGLYALSGAGFALFSLWNWYGFGFLSVGYRANSIYSSGVEGVADFGNTIVASLHYAVCLCAALWLFFKERNSWLLLLWSVCSFVIGVYVVCTFSRAGWVASLSCGATLWLIFFDLKKWRRFAFSAIAVIAVLTYFAYAHFAYEFGVRGFTFRDEVWQSVLAQARLNWLFGAGAGSELQPIIIDDGKQVVHNTHSLYLEVYFQFGIVGLVLMAGVMLLAFRRLWGMLKSASTRDSAAFGFSLLASGSLVMAVELNSFVSTPNLVWLWFWMPLGIALVGCRYKDACC
ncbi:MULTISPECIES: O-antigen ligase family protein [Pseudomonadaceae]|jgi:O-antigen ligase|uniref:O-antigen ligase family protein n=1 Tax=Pseudomonadaceae TaxID=135621 RepID=UPI0009E277F1|nr:MULTISPECIES: O-antigen ligase family protein [Pseudomonas]MBO2925859.1 O-antigen ligase family protein [Pseudomonas otitidis]